MKPKQVGQIFWLVIPFLNKKKWTYARPFLVYRVVNDVDYILLKISNTLKGYIPQFEFSLSNKPSTLYKKDKKSFVDPNILVYIKHELFSCKIDEIVGMEQGQHVLKEDFDDIRKKVKYCFSNEKFRGNRYEVRVI
ncbi:MAG: hypothetical protein MRECE_11c007 [Mycoplasmataceae bacterium CE_OT135]|nr:MAG: hypothetical protein MRECE_31c007 [Mycoplasmataceae bacterium CE_OT135]KLL03656.1 MAG: hypothetical protein MRECE_11c007 [Mycoplasmataceae bacterium CE_OT135]